LNIDNPADVHSDYDRRGGSGDKGEGSNIEQNNVGLDWYGLNGEEKEAVLLKIT